jgi:hypothetical protein
MVQPGDLVNADLVGARPGITAGTVVPAKVLAVTPDEVTVRLDSPFNNEDVFVLAPEKVTPLTPSAS